MRRAGALCAFVCALAVAVIPSCGGGSFVGGGIDGSGLVFGPISGFGSIIVNGIEFDVDAANVTIDGQAATPTDLRLGMLVTVMGTISADSTTGTADSVDFNDAVQGPVSEIDVTAGTFVVVGQRVLTDAATVFDNVTLATLAIGDVVEVSGFIDADMNIRATRVERKSDGEDIEINGYVSNLDTGAETFTIGTLVIDYSTAQINGGDGTGLASLAEGVRVDVKGTGPITGGVLVADTIEIQQPEGGNAGDEVEIEGFVTQVISSTSFVLNGTRQVRTDAQTVFEGGTSADVVVNARLEVKGTVDSMGILVARQVELQSGSEG
jgi:hypothetical protein